MDQIHNSSLSPGVNQLSTTTAASWNNQLYEVGQAYSYTPPNHQFQPFQNWFYSGGYAQNVPVLPPPQFAGVPNSQPISISVPGKVESPDDEEGSNENRPPTTKQSRMNEENKYLDLDSNYQTVGYSPYFPPNNSMFAQSTPKVPTPYLNSALNNQPCQFGVFPNHNAVFSPQFPLMTSSLYGPSSYGIGSSLTQSSSGEDTSGHVERNAHRHAAASSLDSGLSTDNSTRLSSGSSRSGTKRKKSEFEVPGRLALLNGNQKYEISVGEISRRLGPPENMNTSLLGAMLRRAKNKNGGKNLRKTLEDYGFLVPECRRRSLENTAFTALCEAEALNLARDLGQVLHDYFPTREVLLEIALTIQRNYTQQNQAGQNFFQLLEAIENSTNTEQQIDYIVDLLMQMMDSACQVLERDRSLADMGLEILNPNIQPLPMELQKGLLNFNLVTHNFGVKAVLAAYRAICPLPIKGQPTGTPDLRERDD